MNYEKHYKLLIEKAKNREILSQTYTEKHHIVPKCMGGSNEKENLAVLLPHEHLFAHLLLWKIYPNVRGLLYAVLRMSKNKKLTTKKYGWLRYKFWVEQSTNNPSKKPENRKKISKRQTENNIAKRADVRKKMSETKKIFYLTNPSPYKGRTSSMETKLKQSTAAKNRSGNKANRKKQFNLISPTGEIFFCDGTLSILISEFKLSINTLKKHKNKPVPPLTNDYFNTEYRNNTTGWTLLELL